MASAIPTRLYDCENKLLKNSDEIRSETGGECPPYLIVSHVWGEPKDTAICGIKWDVPITEGKFEKVLRYCSEMNIKWVWMDCACIRQKNDPSDASHDKEAEVGKMNQYYRNAFECLCIPDTPEEFMDAYKKQLQLRALVGTFTLDAESTTRVWENIGYLDKLLFNAWFERTWTYQELLLSKCIRLLDGTQLDVEYLGKVVDWYYMILRKGILRKPPGSANYGYIHTEAESVISKGWWVPAASWTVKPRIVEQGSLELMTAVSFTRNKKCKYPADELYGLYGLIQDADKVKVDYGRGLSEEEQTQRGVLEARWKETIKSIVKSGRVWPLLMDAMVKDAAKGEIWIPMITAHELEFGDVHPEVIDSMNYLAPTIDSRGLRLSVKPVGDVVGASANFGDGGGEMNRIITCAWILGAKGFDTRPIKKQMEDGLSKSDAAKGEDPQQAIKALYKALNASSLSKCFAHVERGVESVDSKFGALDDRSLRKLLHYGLGGWNRCVICVAPEERTGGWKPLVFLAWVCRNSPGPQRGRCRVLDVTSVGQAKRWIIANQQEDDTYTKIGTMESHLIQSSDTPMEVILN